MSAAVNFDYTQFLKDFFKYRQPFTIKKPARKLGAVWTSEKVDQRIPVLMCESCWRKYDRWWVANSYRPDWGWAYRSNCDGCAIEFHLCTLFHAEEKFYDVLSNNHGLGRP